MLTRIGVTAAILLICSVMLFGSYPEDYTKWAFGMVGVVVGYWLK
jgi:hypothetical protein